MAARQSVRQVRQVALVILAMGGCAVLLYLAMMVPVLAFFMVDCPD